MNVVVYIMDSVRADHVSAYGYDRPTTPTIDELAADGVLFEHCVSPSTWTRPIAASLLTGLYPSVHGTTTVEHGFNPPIPTVSEQLSANGYCTLGITGMPVLRAENGFDEVFDQYINAFERGDRLKERPSDLRFSDGTFLPRAEDLVNIFQQWETHRDSDEPFFALLWSNEPHQPYRPPEEYRTYADNAYDGPIIPTTEEFSQSHAVESEADLEQFIAYYDGEIEYDDACLSNLIDYLREKDLYQETLLVVAADHGEGFGEHSYQGEYFGHGSGIPPFQEVVHVPCVIRVPEKEVTEQRISELTSLVSIPETIRDYCDLQSPLDDELAPHSWGPVLKGDNESKSNDSGNERNVYVVSDRMRPYGIADGWYCVHTGEWQYMEYIPGDRTFTDVLAIAKAAVSKDNLQFVLRNPISSIQEHLLPMIDMIEVSNESDSERVPGRLYHIGKSTTDDDISGEYPNKAGELRKELVDWLVWCSQQKDSLNTVEHRLNFEDEIKSQLKQLGYIK